MRICLFAVRCACHGCASPVYVISAPCAMHALVVCPTHYMIVIRILPGAVLALRVAQPPSTMATLVGYVAFTEARAKAVDEIGKVHPSIFGSPKRWIPFADTVEHALDKAMTSSRGNPQTATEATQWCVLRVTLAAEECVQAFCAGLIHKTYHGPAGAPQPGWRYYGEMSLGVGHAYEWLQVTLAPVGVDQWAEKALTTHYKRQPDSCCKGCLAAPVTAWIASKSHAQHLFCAMCWLQYFTAMAASSGNDDSAHDAQATPHGMPAFALPEHAP